MSRRGPPEYPPLLPAAGLPADSRTTFKPLQNIPPRLADAGGFGGTGAACGEFCNMPIRNVLGFDLFRQAIPDLLDEIETIAHAQAIDAQ